MQKAHVVVVGAGAFGGWTALSLLRKGKRVLLLDAWGPGNSRASSGGETRIIRATYGANAIYSRMAARSLQLWKTNESRWRRYLYHHTGFLWMVGDGDDYEQASLPVLRDSGIAFEQISADEVKRRYPHINFDGVRWAIFENDGGYLTARLACQTVLEGFLAEGGEYRQLAVTRANIGSGVCKSITLNDGSNIGAEQFVFACGPWLGKIFPDAIGDLIRPTRQEVFYFGTSAGDQAFSDDRFPTWVDRGKHLFYGIPGNQWRGFKLADDTRGPEFDPTSGDRRPRSETFSAVREYLAYRFPALAEAPLLESRVCQYEESPDGNFILDRHPQAENLWLAGGGSGHGFKHGPAVGELLSDLVLADKPSEPFFSLARFRSAYPESR